MQQKQNVQGAAACTCKYFCYGFLWVWLRVAAQNTLLPFCGRNASFILEIECRSGQKRVIVRYTFSERKQEGSWRLIVSGVRARGRVDTRGFVFFVLFLLYVGAGCANRSIKEIRRRGSRGQQPPNIPYLRRRLSRCVLCVLFVPAVARVGIVFLS